MKSIGMKSDTTPVLQGNEQKEANYRKLVRPRLMEQLRDQIIDALLLKKKYRVPTYSAAQLAADLNTNIRYISAVIRVQFHMNYASLVNKYRVEEAMSLLADKRYAHLTIEDISYQVGFVHRQSFYTAFTKLVGTTPNAYREQVAQLSKKQ